MSEPERLGDEPWFTVKDETHVWTRDDRRIVDFIPGPTARRFYLNDVCYPTAPNPIRPQAPVRGAWTWDDE